MIDLKSPSEEPKKSETSIFSDDSLQPTNTANVKAEHRWKQIGIGSLIALGVVLVAILINTLFFAGSQNKQLTGQLIGPDGELVCPEGQVPQEIPYPYGGTIKVCVDAGMAEKQPIDGGPPGDFVSEHEEFYNQAEGSFGFGESGPGTGTGTAGAIQPITGPIVGHAASSGCPSGTEPGVLEGICVVVEKANQLEGPLSCEAGTHPDLIAKICIPDEPSIADTCPEGTEPGAVDGTCIPVDTPEDTSDSQCPSSQVYNPATKNCLSVTSVACTETEIKLDTYREASKQENLGSLSREEIEVLDYLLHLQILKSLDESCHTKISEEKAVDCSSKEMFDTRIDRCAPQPGYKLSQGDIIVDCNSYNEVIKAIDIKLNDSNYSFNEKAKLASLKNNLSAADSACKAELTKAEIERTKQRGGGGAPDSKEFELLNVQAIPEEFNPFAETMSVAFFITNEAYATLEIIEGAKVIKVIEAGKLNAGDRSIRWDGKKQDGGFVSEGDYTWNLIVEKASNRNNKFMAEGQVAVAYFDDQFEMITQPSFEDFTAQGAGNEATSTVATSVRPAAQTSQSVNSPLTQNILVEGQGEANISQVGPADIQYLLLLIPMALIWKPSKKGRKMSKNH